MISNKSINVLHQILQTPAAPNYYFSSPSRLFQIPPNQYTLRLCEPLVSIFNNLFSRLCAAEIESVAVANYLRIDCSVLQCGDVLRPVCVAKMISARTNIESSPVWGIM